jgi:hypothetical protein
LINLFQHSFLTLTRNFNMSSNHNPINPTAVAKQFFVGALLAGAAVTGARPLNPIEQNPMGQALTSSRDNSPISPRYAKYAQSPFLEVEQPNQNVRALQGVGLTPP